MTVRAIDREHVHALFYQRLSTLQVIAGCANRRSYSQTPMSIFRRVGILQLLLNVFNRDQALQVIGIVNHQQLFHAMLVQNFFRAFERGAHRDRNQVLFGHHLADGNVEAGLKAQIAIRQNANQPLVLGDRHAGNFVLAHHFQRIGNLRIRRHRDGIDDHPAL